MIFVEGKSDYSSSRIIDKSETPIFARAIIEGVLQVVKGTKWQKPHVDYSRRYAIFKRRTNHHYLKAKAGQADRTTNMPFLALSQVRLNKNGALTGHPTHHHNPHGSIILRRREKK